MKTKIIKNDYCKSMGVECDEREFDKEISGYICALDDDYNMAAGGIKHENESYIKSQFDNLNAKILNLDYSSNLAPNSNKWELPISKSPRKICRAGS